MKLFIKKLIFFLSPILIISLPLDFFLSSQLKKDGRFAYGECSVWNSIFEGNIDSDIVIYGSSRTQDHIDPQIIEDSLNASAFNLGIQGYHFWMQYLRHILFLEHNRTPRHIILTVDAFSLEKRDDLYNPEQFLPYMLFNNLMRYYTKSYQGYSFFDYYIPLLRYRGKNSAIFRAVRNSISLTNDPPVRIKGFQGVKKEWSDDFKKAKDKMDYYEVKLDTASIHLFEKFLTECKERKINVIFVYTPEYIEGQAFLKNRKEVISLYEDFAAKYSIPFLNYSNDEICKNDKYFFNTMQLNKRGALIFSNKLAMDLKNFLAQTGKEIL